MSESAQFLGRYDHCLDAKSRLILPAKLRPMFGTIAFLTRHHESCIAIWREEEFKIELVKKQALLSQDTEARNLVRAWSASVVEQDIDKQWRILIPQELRKYGHLQNEVIVVGVIDHVEIWSPEVWQEQVGALEEQVL